MFLPHAPSASSSSPLLCSALLCSVVSTGDLRAPNSRVAVDVAAVDADVGRQIPLLVGQLTAEARGCGPLGQALHVDLGVLAGDLREGGRQGVTSSGVSAAAAGRWAGPRRVLAIRRALPRASLGTGRGERRQVRRVGAGGAGPGAKGRELCKSVWSHH
jgi:hypothetical protein